MLRIRAQNNLGKIKRPLQVSSGPNPILKARPIQITSSQALNYFKDGDSIHPLNNLLQYLIVLIKKKISSYLIEISCTASWDHYLASYHWALWKYSSPIFFTFFHFEKTAIRPFSILSLFRRNISSSLSPSLFPKCLGILSFAITDLYTLGVFIATSSWLALNFSQLFLFVFSSAHNPICVQTVLLHEAFSQHNHKILH